MTHNKRQTTSDAGFEAQPEASVRTGVAGLPLLAPILIVAVLVAAYANSLDGVLLFDDRVHIVQNDRIAEPDSLSDLLSGKRPLVDVSLAINHAAQGFDVGGYHAFNISIHVLATLALFGIVRRTLRRRSFEERFRTRAVWLALTVALAWGVHPLATQSVTYVIQRAESMMGLFYLSTLYCVVRCASSDRGLGWAIAAVGCCALGMGCKAVMITAPVVILLYDRTFLATSWAAILHRRWGLYVGLAATWSVLWACGVAGSVLNASNSNATVGFGFTGVTPWEYLCTQCGVLATYMRLSLWPHPLCLDHTWPTAKSASSIVPAGIVIVALLVGGAWGLFKRQAWGFLVISFFLLLAPTSSIVPIKDMFFEHRTYLSSAAVVTLIVLGGFAFMSHGTRRLGWSTVSQRVVVIGLAIATVVVLGAGTVQRNRTYRSALTMWLDVVAKRPNNARGFDQLAGALVEEGRKTEAIPYYRQAVRIDPDFASAHANLGNALLETGQVEGSVPHLREAVRLDPTRVLAQVNLGYALQALGHREESVAAFEAATRIKHRRTDLRLLANAHFSLGAVLGQDGLFDRAETEFRRAIELFPEYVKAHVSLGQVLLALRRAEEAIESFDRALQIEPGNESATRMREQALRMN